MGIVDTLRGGQPVDTLVIGRSCSHIEQKKMLLIGRVLIDGFGDGQYAISGDRPIKLTVGKRTIDAYVCCADRGTTVTLGKYLSPGQADETPDELSASVKLDTGGLLARLRKKGWIKALIISPDGETAELADVRKVGPYLVNGDRTLFRIADDTAPLSMKSGRKTIPIYIVDRERRITASLFMDGNPAIMPSDEIKPDTVDKTGGFRAGTLFSLRTSPDLASTVWDSNLIKFGWELATPKRMMLIAFIAGIGTCFFGMLILGMLM